MQDTRLQGDITIDDLALTRRALIPTLLWLHSKKHAEKNITGQWHGQWATMAGMLFPGSKPTIYGVNEKNEIVAVEGRMRDLEDFIHANGGRGT